MTYKRVVPRDLFNEANYLKCVGQIGLKLLDYPHQYPNVKLDSLEYEEQGLKIYQCLYSGATYDRNLMLIINDISYHIERPLNSRDKYPVYITIKEESFTVLNEIGEFSDEFKTLINQ